MQEDQASGRRAGTVPLRVKLARVAGLVMFVPGALACFVGAWLLVTRDGGRLLDDTRAWLGSGTADGVPLVSGVDCVERSHRGGTRSLQVREWICVIDLAPRQAPVAAPRPGANPIDVVEENLRRLAELRRPGARASSRLERMLASNRTGDIPTLRRLSREGEAPRYGIVWGLSELAGRWFTTAFMSALLVGIGAGLLFITWLTWRRPPAARGPGAP